MRLANLQDRSVLLLDGSALDVEHASDGRFSSDPMAAFDDWAAFTAWASGADFGAARPFAEEDLGTPVPRPRQVFAVGLNYRDHAKEANLDVPDYPVVFTKYASCLSGPVTEVTVPGKTMDYEAELVIVIGSELKDADEQTALAAVAGYSVGQDFSERTVQQRPPAPQFNLGKSFPGFGPFGPAVVSPDEVPDPGALGVRCVISGPTARAQGSEQWTAQDGNTRDLIFPIGELLSYLSGIVTLYPGDIVFTGTPAGIGQPQGIALQPGDVVTTSIDGLGELVNTLV
jgi:2,4-didehydro-3-deoxy-L-rhamnonate hydrolase